MKKTYEFVAVNGRPAASVSVTVYNYGTANLATLYSDSAGTIPQNNPVVTDVNGYYEFYAADGRYSLAYSGTAITPRTLTDLIIDDTLNPVAADAARVGAEDGAAGSLWTTVQGFINKIISSVGSAYVGFIQSGADAVATTAQDELRVFIRPEQFGAIGDGTTNDSVAVQRALTYALTSKKVVRLTNGKTYNCTGATLDISCHIEGCGATIKGYLRVTGDDLLLKDFNLVGTNASIGIYLFGSTTVPTRYYRQKLHNIKITFDTGVATADSFGLYASNIDNLEVKGCNILYGVQLIGCTDYLIDGNVLDGDNYSNNNELIHASRKSIGQIVNNTFIDSLDNYIDLYSSGAKTIISGNRFLGCHCRLGTAIEIKISLTDTPANTSSDTNGWSEQIIISDNYFGNTVPSVAGTNSVISIYYIDSRSVPSFTWAETPRNIHITDNIFDGVDSSALASGYCHGVVLDTVAGVVISGNTFRNMNLGASLNDISSCIWVENSRDILIEGNRLSMNAGTGISLHRDCTELTIANNHLLQDLNKSYTLKYGIRITKEGSRADPTITYSKFTGNTIYCSISAFRQLYYASGYMRDCLVQANVFQQEASFQNITRCTITDNSFEVTATRNYGIDLGNTSVVTAHNIVTGNTVKTPVGTPKTAISVVRMRGSQISGNTIHTATYGILVAGTNTAGELDYLNIKDNFSVSQTMANFPDYSLMAAGDTATLQAANNQKIT